MATLPETESDGPEPDDEELVAAARRGEAWGRNVLVMRHAPAVARLAYHLLGNDRDVDDLIQDCFVEALEGLHSLRHAHAFGSWLKLIVVRAAARLIRRRRIGRRLGLSSDRMQSIENHVNALRAQGAPADVVLELEHLYRAISSLPTDMRVALVLRRVEGLPLEEIARLTGASLATVKRRVARAEEALSEEHR